MLIMILMSCNPTREQWGCHSLFRWIAWTFGTSGPSAEKEMCGEKYKEK